MTHKIPPTRGKFARVSTVDYGYLNQFKWQCPAKGYAVRTEYDPETRQSRTLFMHKIVMDAPSG